MNGRRVVLALGVALTAVGVVFTVVPGLARAFPTSRRAVPILGAVAVLGALVVAFRRRAAAFDRAETGDPEALVEVPAPGDESRTAFRQAASFRVTGSEERVRERIEAAAVAVVRRRFDCDEATARAMIATGEWTDDEIAAAFLGGEEGRDPPRVPTRAWLRAESPFVYRARRTVDAVIERTEMEVDP